MEKEADRLQLGYLALHSANRLASQGGRLSEVVAMIRVQQEELEDRDTSLGREDLR